MDIELLLLLAKFSCGQKEKTIVDEEGNVHKQKKNLFEHDNIHLEIISRDLSKPSRQIQEDLVHPKTLGPRLKSLQFPEVRNLIKPQGLHKVEINRDPTK